MIIKQIMKFYFFIFYYLLFLVSCENSTKLAVFASNEASSDPAFYQINKAIHPTRAETLKKAIEIYNTGQTCVNFEECKQICLEIYTAFSNRKECKSLPVDLVKTFFKVHKAYQSKNFQQIQNIKPFDLKAFLVFDLNPFLNSIQDSGKHISKEILRWTAYNWETAQVFLEEDLDHRLIESLLRELEFKPIKSLREIMDNGRTFQEIAILKQNDSALFWANGFLNKQCQQSQSQEDCLLGHYCLISAHWADDTAQELNEFVALKKILNSKASKLNNKQTNLKAKTTLKENTNLNTKAKTNLKENTKQATFLEDAKKVIILPTLQAICPQLCKNSSLYC